MRPQRNASTDAKTFSLALLFLQGSSLPKELPTLVWGRSKAEDRTAELLWELFFHFSHLYFPDLILNTHYFMEYCDFFLLKYPVNIIFSGFSLTLHFNEYKRTSCWQASALCSSQEKWRNWDSHKTENSSWHLGRLSTEPVSLQCLCCRMKFLPLNGKAGGFQHLGKALLVRFVRCGMIPQHWNLAEVIELYLCLWKRWLNILLFFSCYSYHTTVFNNWGGDQNLHEAGAEVVT